jgi:hypothetical protein
MNIEKRGVGNMVYEQLRLKSLRIGFPNGEKCLFFKNDSCLSNCLPVFTQKPPDNSKLKVKLSSKELGVAAGE